MSVTQAKSEVNLKQAAIELARQGWRVFPLQPRGKVPRIKGWIQKATTDEETIRQWWDRWPNSNIGIATGQAEKANSVVVLDVDGEAGEKSMRELQNAHKGELPDTLQVRTGSGGRHIYFAHPGVYIGISAGSIGTGLDIRGDRGLVVAPPSIHPKTKRRYEWI